MKRFAQAEITKEVLQTGEIGANEQQEEKNTAEEIAARRIAKIKGSKKDDSKVQTSEGLKLAEPLIQPNDSKPQLFPLSGSLFSNLATKSSEQSQQGGLFGNLAGLQPNQDGLFNLNNKPAPVGIFSQNTTGGGLFSQFGQNTAITTGGGLFGSLPQGWLPTNNNNNQDDDDEEGGDDEPLEDKSEGKPEESKANYQYEQHFDKIVNISINKFKVNEQDPALQGFISLEKLKDNQQYFIVYRNSTKLVQHQGLILPFMKFNKLNNRDDCISMFSYQIAEEEEEEVKDKKEEEEEEKEKKKNEEEKDKKEEEKDKKEEEKDKKENQPAKKIKTNNLKIMFKNKDDCQSFTKELKDIIEQLQLKKAK